MDVALRRSEHTYDFHRPVTVVALGQFDPDLRLVFNRRYECFQVMRVRHRTRRWKLNNGEYLAFIEPVLVHITDWHNGLFGRDDPDSLIRHLWESDLQRHPDLMRKRREVIQANLERSRKHIKEEYRHAGADNSRLLQKAWEPFFNFPALVK
jgi:hypothetical protein